MLGSLMVDLSTNLPWYLCAQKSKINVEWGNKCKNKGMNERDLGGSIWAVSSPHSSSPPGGWEGKESHTCTAKAEETGRGCKGCEGHPAVDLKEMRTSSLSAAFLLFLVMPHYRRWNSEFIAPGGHLFSLWQWSSVAKVRLRNVGGADERHGPHQQFAPQ